MREINKTFYEVLKLDEPEDGINVTQIITDDIVKKQEDGEVKAVRGATELLNRKADELYKEKNKKPVKKVLKASGNKTKMQSPPKDLPGIPSVPPNAEPSTKTTAAVPQKKVAKKVVKTNSDSTVQIKTSGTVPKKKVAKQVKAQEEAKKKSNPLLLITLLILILGVAGYVYMTLQ
jgi:hypothetical protein